MAYQSPQMDRELTSLGILNGPVAVWCLLMCFDMIYAPIHRLLHTPFLYRWIHKHHHRVTYPHRGSVDARNEHPVEQILALIFWYCALRLSTLLVGMHAVVVPLHLRIMTLSACFNHTESDLELS